MKRDWITDFCFRFPNILMLPKYQACLNCLDIFDWYPKSQMIWHYYAFILRQNQVGLSAREPRKLGRFLYWPLHRRKLVSLLEEAHDLAGISAQTTFMKSLRLAKLEYHKMWCNWLLQNLSERSKKKMIKSKGGVHICKLPIWWFNMGKFK